MRSPRLLTLLAVACGGLNSCAWLGADDAAVPATNPNAPKLVGRIAAVPVDRRYVLIQSYGKWTATPGSVLTTRGPDGRTANLLATGESLDRFAAADLQSGTLAEGDAVYSLPSAEPKTTSDTDGNPAEAAPSQPPAAGPPTKQSEAIEKMAPENSKKNNQPF